MASATVENTPTGVLHKLYDSGHLQKNMRSNDVEQSAAKTAVEMSARVNETAYLCG